MTTSRVKDRAEHEAGSFQSTGEKGPPSGYHKRGGLGTGGWGTACETASEQTAAGQELAEDMRVPSSSPYLAGLAPGSRWAAIHFSNSAQSTGGSFERSGRNPAASFT